MKKDNDNLLEVLTEYEAGTDALKKQTRKPFTTSLYATFLHTARLITVIVLVVGIAAAANSIKSFLLIPVVFAHIIMFCGTTKGINESLQDVQKGHMP